jgi:hypothetical protein
LFCFLVELGYELRALSLQRRCSTTSATLPDHFAWFILKLGSPELLPRSGSRILPISFSQVVKITGVSHYTGLILIILYNMSGFHISFC